MHDVQLMETWRPDNFPTEPHQRNRRRACISSRGEKKHTNKIDKTLLNQSNPIFIMKTKIERMTFHCTNGNHEATGSRYTDYDGGWSC